MPVERSESSPAQSQQNRTRLQSPGQWIAGHTIVPAHTGKSKTRLVHDRGRERVYPTGAGYLRGIVVVRWEEDRKNSAGEVFAGTLRIEPVEFVRISQIVVDLKVFLVV